MLAHPKIVPYLNVICGQGFRMVRFHTPKIPQPFPALSCCFSWGWMVVVGGWQDHAPTLITQTQGAPNGNLHGSSGPGFDTNQYYM